MTQEDLELIVGEVIAEIQRQGVEIDDTAETGSLSDVLMLGTSGDAMVRVSPDTVNAGEAELRQLVKELREDLSALDDSTSLGFVNIANRVSELDSVSVKKVKINGSEKSPDYNGVVDLGTITGGGTVDTSQFATKEELNGKQDTLVSGTNIKTINNQSILGEGNITITGGEGVDDAIAAQVDENTSNIEKLMKEIFPLTVTLSVSPSDLGEHGTSREFTISWTIKVAGVDVTPSALQLSIGGAVVDGLTTSDKSYKWTTSSSQSVVLTAAYNGMQAEGRTSINFAYPAYMEVVSSNFIVSANNVKGLTKLSLLSSKSRAQTFGAVKLQKIVYAYAKIYGALTSIVDGNNINLIENYTRSEITINGTTYYVYITTEAFSTTGSFTYNFK